MYNVFFSFPPFPKNRFLKTISTVCLLSLSSCMAGPNYHRPSAITSPHFKELQPVTGWVKADPNLASAEKGEWWKLYNDPLLNQLEEQIDISNQNLKQAEASYRNARAMIDQVRAGFFPTLSIGPSFNRQGNGGGATGIGSGGNISYAKGQTKNTYALQTAASWDLDLWGKIRRNTQSQVAAAQASAADLANARLSYQSQLAQTYFNLRYQDSLMDLLQKNIDFYEASLRVTQNQHNAGTIEPTALLQAKTQLQQTKAQLTQAGIARAQYEHAIAILIGKPPAELSIPRGSLSFTVPAIPVEVPATLLQRRPDIASAERAMEEQNAQIGAAIAAFYPDVTLSASLSYSGTPVGSLIQVANRIWSLGASASETLFDGGSRTSLVKQAEAQYDMSVATYRQTVLEAIQGVEDQLSNLRILEQQYIEQQQAVSLANQTAQIALNQYKVGTQDYTTVVTQQITSLSNQQTALGIQQQRMVDSVLLIQNLGGGWNDKRLPSKSSLTSNLPFVPSFMQKNPN
ncbi:NodT family RND efflux system, outer membrane lipoprotein [Commensalibacter papalotli (ex Servin-Garciduenas et al. 2014)]|uniref:NodT family RND efflux system, outer membrane lipoprotein n=2 Tax=Commensalibacter TaxID=1079922 RepID=W7E548_9PROT|nr:NodT family RND efflux system, outer membrane lipoprotein [Commensalibacter papalotli (ex Servin-Garciduenas et al. 2014)]